MVLKTMYSYSVCPECLESIKNTVCEAKPSAVVVARTYLVAY